MDETQLLLPTDTAIVTPSIVTTPEVKPPRRNKKNLDINVDIYSSMPKETFLETFGNITMTSFRQLTANEQYWIVNRTKQLVAEEVGLDFRVWNLYGVINEWVNMTDGISDAVKRGVFDNINLDTNPMVNKLLPWVHVQELRERRGRVMGYTPPPDLNEHLYLMKVAYAIFIPQIYNQMRKAGYEKFKECGGTDEQFKIQIGDDYTKAVDSAIRPIMKLLRRVGGIEIPRADMSGFDIQILKKSYEEKKKMVGPWKEDDTYNIFIANNYSRSKIAPHILVLYDCDSHGYIVRVWGATMDLECRADGTGDVKFIPQTKKKTDEEVNSARASIPVTWEMITRPNFHHFCGDSQAFKEKRSERFRLVPYLATEDILNYKNLQPLKEAAKL